MGNMLCKNSFSSLFGKRTIRIVMLGLCHAGKTTILFRLKLGEVIATFPTIGQVIETIEYKNLNFEICEMCGGDRIWPLFRIWFPNEHSQDLIFVVDSHDREEIDRAGYELKTLWDNSVARRDVALLIFANKQDLPDAMNEEEVIEKLGLRSFKKKNWHVQTSCAITGDGLYEGLEWLYNQLKDIKH